MRASIRGILTLSVAVVYGTASFAATVSPVNGDILINRGQGFQKAIGAVEAKIGDSIMVSPQGQATVGYSDGCSVNLQAGAVFTVTDLSPCTSGSFAQQQPTNTLNPLVVGGVIIGTVVLAAVLISQNNKKSSSP